MPAGASDANIPALGQKPVRKQYKIARAATAVTLITLNQSISPILRTAYIEVQMNNCGEECDELVL
jgi:hypothetical protein